MLKTHDELSARIDRKRSRFRQAIPSANLHEPQHANALEHPFYTTPESIRSVLTCELYDGIPVITANPRSLSCRDLPFHLLLHEVARSQQRHLSTSVTRESLVKLTQS
jgi:hypothetical protein